MELSVLKPGSSEAGTVSVSDLAFAREYNEDLVHQVVTAFRAGSRQGTRAQKNRAAVNGGGKKPWRQKGTGRARAGTVRSPLWRTGGVTFGPQPRDYSYALPRKKKRVAARRVLSSMIEKSRVTVVAGAGVIMRERNYTNAQSTTSSLSWISRMKLTKCSRRSPRSVWLK